MQRVRRECKEGLVVEGAAGWAGETGPAGYGEGILSFSQGFHEASEETGKQRVGLRGERVRDHPQVAASCRVWARTSSLLTGPATSRAPTLECSSTPSSMRTRQGERR